MSGLPRRESLSPAGEAVLEAFERRCNGVRRRKGSKGERGWRGGDGYLTVYRQPLALEGSQSTARQLALSWLQARVAHDELEKWLLEL
jgi:hypothetical protein